jgi:DNA topoisomerase IA
MSAIFSSAARVPTGSDLIGQDTRYAHTLVDLQDEALQRYGMSRAYVLATACALYERGLITYPRVEERLLLAKQFDELSRIVRDYKMASRNREYDPEHKGPVWVDEVPGAHIGITLTSVSAGAIFGVAMTEDEARIYGLVHARFLELFRPRGA